MGDNVMARNYRRGPKWLPGVVAEVKGPLSYIIQIKGGTLCRRHINQLRNGVADTQLDNIPFSSSTDNKPAISDITESSEAPTTKSSEVPTTEPTSRYPQRDHNPPDRYTEQY